MLFFCLILLGIALTVIAVEDWKSYTVSGVKCLLCWGLIFFVWKLLNAPIVVGVILIVSFILFYALPEMPAIGSADFLPLAMYICVFLVDGLVSPLVFMYPLSLLASLIPYGKLYGRMHGYAWKFGSKVYMPALPCFAAAWWISAFACVIYFIARG